MTRNFIFKILKCLIILLLLLLFTRDTKGNFSDSKNDSLDQSKHHTPLDQVIQPDDGIEENKRLLFIHTSDNIMNVTSGSNLELECEPNIKDPAPVILWTRNDVKIKRIMREVIYKKWSIQLEEVIPNDSGLYTCLVCSIRECISHSTNVVVYNNYPVRPIIITQFFHNQTVLRNSDTSLECRVISNMDLTISWIQYTEKNESIENLESLLRKNKLTKDELKKFVRFYTDPKHILNFFNVSHDDEGWYSCYAENPVGHAIASAYIRVIDDDKVPKQNYDKVLKENDKVKMGRTEWITISVVVLVVIIFIGTIYMVYVLLNRKYLKQEQQRSEAIYQWTKTVIITVPASDESSGDLQIPDVKIVKQRIALTASPNKDPAIEFSEYDFPLDCSWEIPRSQIFLGSTLGEGAFGRVVMAQVSLATTVVVAVKMIKDDYTDADVISLVREMELMKIIGSHKNIINLLGCCSQNGPLWVIVEFARNGNLKDFLKNNRYSCLAKEIHLTEKHLTTFALQIAQGMEYLASKRCIHRDLAARNVLVSDDYIMKIADFGLARDIHESDYYRKYTNGRLPIKWMAPESLQARFYNSQSDVWSYGVLLWEIMSYGDQPYPNIMSSAELYSYLVSGNRMEIPKGCSHNIYNLMLQCWYLDSNARSTFTEIVKILDEIIQLSSIKFNTRYVNLPEPVLNKEEEERTLVSDSISYTPMFRMSK